MPDAIEHAPSSLEEAEARRLALTGDVQRLQSELGQKTRTDADGRRLTNDVYWAWRDRAQCELADKLSELRSLKFWIKANQRRDISAAGETVRHLVALYDLLEHLQVKDISLKAQEVDVVTMAGAHLRNIGAIT